MAVAIHEGGPVDGLRLRTDTAPQTRFWLPADQRTAKRWLTLARYVFVPPRDGARCRYRYTGEDQVFGPVPGGTVEPDWS